MLTVLHRGSPGSPTVVAFPHAGGSARFFAHWSAVLPGTTLIGVTYPGRDTRVDESYADGPHGDDLAGAARAVADAITADGLGSPVLVGHSMGAYVAYETGAALTRAGAAGVRVAVSGQNSPDHRPGTALHRADDAALVDDVLRQNPASAAVWEVDELRAMFLPPLREDYRVLETYVPTSTEVGEILVCHGDGDEEVSPERLAGWSARAVHVHPRAVLSGGHFYLQAPDVQLPRRLAACFGLA